MCVLIFAETWNEKLKKSSLETISFGKILANMLNSKIKVVVFSNSEENLQLLEIMVLMKFINSHQYNLKELKTIN